MNKTREENFDSLLEKALEENFEEELASVKVEKFPLSKSFQNKMTSLIKKEDKRKINLLKKVAIYLLIFAGASSLLVSTNQGAKAAFQSLWDWANEYRKITWLDDHISIDVKRKDEDNIRVEFKEEFIPDGYKLINFEDFDEMKVSDFENKEGKRIHLFIISTKAHSSIGIDNEHIIYSHREIKGNEYLIGEGKTKDNGNIATIEFKGYYYQLYGHADIDELIDILEKIFENMEKTL